MFVRKISQGKQLTKQYLFGNFSNMDYLNFMEKLFKLYQPNLDFWIGNMKDSRFLNEFRAKTIKNNALNRDDRIRTCGILLPKQARYQAALHPGGYVSNQLDVTCFQTTSH
jgi:N-acetylmuramoyl-L-alanine amidase